MTDYDKTHLSASLRNHRIVSFVAAVFCLAGVVTLVMGIDEVAFGLLVLLTIVASINCISDSADIRELELDIRDVVKKARKG